MLRGEDPAFPSAVAVTGTALPPPILSAVNVPERSPPPTLPARAESEPVVPWWLTAQARPVVPASLSSPVVFFVPTTSTPNPPEPYDSLALPAARFLARPLTTKPVDDNAALSSFAFTSPPLVDRPVARARSMEPDVGVC